LTHLAWPTYNRATTRNTQPITGGMSVYKDYARVYDRSGQLAFSLRMIDYLKTLFCRHPVYGRTHLELACGTGTVAVAMAKAGWHVYGVDASADMLAQARAKIDEHRVDVILSQQDMRHFVIPAGVHLATCLYDSINYMLTNDDLLAVIRRVYNVLKPGGLFCFDMNTPYALEMLWDDETHVTESDGLTVIFRSKYDRRHQRVAVVATVFEREGDTYHKIVEEHVEQAYPMEQVATLLADTGFRIEAHYSCFTLRESDEETYRIMWVARKPGGPHAS